MIARVLVQRGVSDVILIERATLGAEASYAAGGILDPRLRRIALTNSSSLPAKAATCIRL